MARNEIFSHVNSIEYAGYSESTVSMTRRASLKTRLKLNLGEIIH
jgi:hypothetical protein